MGTCKDEMKPKTDEGKSIFGKIMPRRKRDESKEKKAETFADHLTACYESLGKLIDVKTAELKAESGKEEYNRKALSMLKTMEFHLESVMDIAAEYSES